MLSGILVGIGCYIDISGFYVFAAVMILLLVAKEYSIKEKILQLLFYLMCVVTGYFVMFCLWHNFTFNLSIFEVWFLDKTASFYTFLGLYENISLQKIFSS